MKNQLISVGICTECLSPVSSTYVLDVLVLFSVFYFVVFRDSSLPLFLLPPAFMLPGILMILSPEEILKASPFAFQAFTHLTWAPHSLLTGLLLCSSAPRIYSLDSSQSDL